MHFVSHDPDGFCFLFLLSVMRIPAPAARAWFVLVSDGVCTMVTSAENVSVPVWMLACPFFSGTEAFPQGSMPISCLTVISEWQVFMSV